MKDIDTKKRKFYSRIDSDLTDFVSHELGPEFVVYKLFNEENDSFIQWSLVNLLERKDLAHSENREEFLNLVNTIGNYRNDTGKIRRFGIRA